MHGKGAKEERLYGRRNKLTWYVDGERGWVLLGKMEGESMYRKEGETPVFTRFLPTLPRISEEASKND